MAGESESDGVGRQLLDTLRVEDAGAFEVLLAQQSLVNVQGHGLVQFVDEVT